MNCPWIVSRLRSCKENKVDLQRLSHKFKGKKANGEENEGIQDSYYSANYISVT